MLSNGAAVVVDKILLYLFNISRFLYLIALMIFVSRRMHTDGLTLKRLIA